MCPRIAHTLDASPNECDITCFVLCFFPALYSVPLFFILNFDFLLSLLHAPCCCCCCAFDSKWKIRKQFRDSAFCAVHMRLQIALTLYIIKMILADVLLKSCCRFCVHCRKNEIISERMNNNSSNESARMRFYSLLLLYYYNVFVLFCFCIFFFAHAVAMNRQQRPYYLDIEIWICLSLTVFVICVCVCVCAQPILLRLPRGREKITKAKTNKI